MMTQTSKFLSVLNSALADLNIAVSPAAAGKMVEHFCLLEEWNQRFNLTRNISPEDAAIKNFADSLLIDKAIEFRPGMRAADVGSGAGFPGSPLAIIHPEV